MYTKDMSISQLRLNNVRSHELFVAEFDPHVTLVLGSNGAGKTSLLEAIYYLMSGSSFRGRARDMISRDSTRADMVLTGSDGERRASLQLLADNRVKKTFTVQSRQSARLPMRHRQPVVLFEPDELRLIGSSPERRRRFFDDVIARLYPAYGTILSRYQRTLLQRNELLKRRETTAADAWDAHLFAWDIKFAELAVEITRQRREFVVTSNTHLSKLYSQIAGAPHHITMNYHSHISADNYQQKLLDRLHADRLSDSYRGYTSHGPHRDDFLIHIDSQLASTAASRGEMRTIMLAYKLLEVQLQQELSQRAPLILLDDVFSELDRDREQQLICTLSDYQTIITATDLRDSLKARGSNIITLSPQS